MSMSDSYHLPSSRAHVHLPTETSKIEVSEVIFITKPTLTRQNILFISKTFLFISKTKDSNFTRMRQYFAGSFNYPNQIYAKSFYLPTFLAIALRGYSVFTIVSYTYLAHEAKPENVF